MRVLTINELWRLTRIELSNLARRITAELRHSRRLAGTRQRAYQPAQHPLRAGVPRLAP